jgi:DNA-binding SARP family transcriptional activator/predicted negative regulator of RcsB-dependent stress response
VLAVLLLNGNRATSVDRLIDAVWAEAPPVTARAVVHSYVSRLRALFQPDRRSPTRQPLMTVPTGYLLRVQPEELDLFEFDRRVDRARQARAAGRPDEAVTEFRAALALWRGPALAGLGTGRLAAEARGLEERRMVTLEERIEQEFRLGRHGEVIAELQALTATHPFRETLVGQLMIALYESGRQGEALETYQRTRRTMIEELGIEPGRALRQLQQDILRGQLSTPEHNPVSAHSAPQPATRTTVVPVPRQLPPDLSDFTGRQDALRQARRLVVPGGGSKAPTVTVISGKAGVGKTTMAVHLAHRLDHRFPDGQLFTNLRGTDALALPPAEVVAGFLTALGVDSGAVPPDLDQRIALYRSLTADRRVLVVLDNAANEEQVRPLLPSGSRCAALVTSRPRLSGLEGARPLRLDVLHPDEALDLFARVVGAHLVADEPEAARSIVGYCGCLPLAVRVAAVRLAVRPGRPLRTLAQRLGDERRRLHELRVGDLDVQASLALSYRSQDSRTRRAFRLLAVLEAASFPTWLAGPLLNQQPDTGEKLVERLVDVGLLETVVEDEAGQARFGFHDLVRAFARDRLQQQDSGGQRAAALQRAASTYLDRAAAATPTWFAAERTSLVALTQQLHNSGLWEPTWQLALAISAFLEAHSFWDDWRRTHEAALDATRCAGNRVAEANVLRRLGDLHLDQSDWNAASACFTACLPVFRSIGDRRGEAQALAGLGDTHRECGQLTEAASCLDDCLSIFRELGDARGEAEALRSLGILHRQQGRLEDALTQLETSLEVSQRLEDPRWEAIVRRSLGIVHRDRGDHAAARTCFERCLVTLKQVDDRLWQAYTQTSLGQVLREQGALEKARAVLADSVAAFQVLHDRCGEGWALQALSDVLGEQGRLVDAHAAVERALAIFRQLGNEPGEAWALQSLGDILLCEDRRDEALPLLKKALELARRLGVQPCLTRAQASLEATTNAR